MGNETLYTSSSSSSHTAYKREARESQGTPTVPNYYREARDNGGLGNDYLNFNLTDELEQTWWT